jgi:hypothetical protein
MSNTQAMCTSFKAEVLNGVHQFGSPTIVSRTSLTAPTPDVMKGALYFASATLNAATTVYSATGEVGNSGSYVAGGLVSGFTTWNAPTTGSTEGYTTPTASWTTGSGFSATAFDTLFLYNSTQINGTGRAIAVFTFGSQTIASGTFTLTMPTNSNGTALVRFT